MFVRNKSHVVNCDSQLWGHMMAHSLWSCSFINMTLVCYITTIGFGETSKRPLTHYDWKGDLLISHPHIGYSVQRYISTTIWGGNTKWVQSNGSWGQSYVGSTSRVGGIQVDVRNAFNLVFRATVFQESWFSIGTLDQFFPFVQQFYAHPSPLYFLEAFRHEDLIVISSLVHNRGIL